MKAGSITFYSVKTSFQPLIVKGSQADKMKGREEIARL